MGDKYQLTMNQKMEILVLAIRYFKPEEVEEAYAKIVKMLTRDEDEAEEPIIV
jgi:hypothetical protein